MASHELPTSGGQIISITVETRKVKLITRGGQRTPMVWSPCRYATGEPSHKNLGRSDTDMFGRNCLPAVSGTGK
jgi:hypothetical protein